MNDKIQDTVVAAGDSAKSGSRRTFMKGSAAVSGGLMFGFVVPTAIRRAEAAGTVYTPNAWVHIADNNTITLISARSEMGQGVYTALPMLIAEELGVDIKSVRVAIAPPNAALYGNAVLGGAQITGGSASVRDGWEKLRLGAAQVREMLITAAASKWGVDRSTLTAANGRVSGGGKSATYGQLAAAASKVPVPEKVALKDPKNFKIVGTSVKRIDTPPKVNGTATYGIDVKMPGMVYASVEQCPVIGGKVKSFDGAAAKGMPGVIDVIQINDGVAVVAKSYWQAAKARKSLKVEWDEGAFAAASTKSIMDGIKAASGTAKVHAVGKPVGNVDEAMKTAAKTLSAEYWSQYLAHAPIEPMNFTASYADGKMQLIGPTQFQQGAAGAVAAVLKMKPEDVSVETTFLGGGFGRRIELDFIVQAAEISKAVGKPVKVLWSREDDMTHDFYRPAAYNQMSAGLDASGKPVALAFKVTSQSVTQRAFGLPKDTLDPFMVEAAVAPYEIANTKHDLVIHDSGMRVGYWRSVSHPFSVFANESFMDEMAKAAGKDPYEYRMALLTKAPRFANVLKEAAARGDWGKPVAAGRGRGIAVMEGYDSYLAMVVEASLKDGEVVVHKCTTVADVGHMINPDICEAQIQSSIVFGLSAALQQEITIEKGRVQQTNYNNFPPLRMSQNPEMVTHMVKSSEKPGGIGEPAVALVTAATANAIAALGKRVRSLPMTKDAIAKA